MEWCRTAPASSRGKEREEGRRRRENRTEQKLRSSQKTLCGWGWGTRRQRQWQRRHHPITVKCQQRDRQTERERDRRTKDRFTKLRSPPDTSSSKVGKGNFFSELDDDWSIGPLRALIHVRPDSLRDNYRFNFFYFFKVDMDVKGTWMKEGKRIALEKCLKGFDSRCSYIEKRHATLRTNSIQPLIRPCGHGGNERLSTLSVCQVGNLQVSTKIRYC